MRLRRLYKSRLLFCVSGMLGKQCLIQFVLVVTSFLMARISVRSGHHSLYLPVLRLPHGSPALKFSSDWRIAAVIDDTLRLAPVLRLRGDRRRRHPVMI